MRKFLVFALLVSVFVTASLSAYTLKGSWGYGELGVGPLPLPVPVFGVGYRTQEGCFGWDTSLKVSTLVAVTHVKGSVIRHYYFNPNPYSQFYCGLGASVGALFDHRSLGLFSPELVFGKQYMTETGGMRFFQAQASFPTVGYHATRKNVIGHHNITFLPLIVLSYGVLF